MSEINTTLGTFKGTKISSDAPPETMCKEARKIERANRQQLNAAGIPNSGNTTSTMLCPGEVSKSGFSCYSRLERLKMVFMKKLTQIFCKGQQSNQRKEGIELCDEGPKKKHDYGGRASRRGGHAEACILLIVALCLKKQ